MCVCCLVCVNMWVCGVFQLKVGFGVCCLWSVSVEGRFWCVLFVECFS